MLWTEAGGGSGDTTDLGGSWQEPGRGVGKKKTKFKVDELFTAANNPGLTYSHSEHPKL